MSEPSHLREIPREREESEPDQPTDLPRRAWPGVLKRTLREYKADNLGDLAAALTYYGVLAIFPVLIVVVSLLGLLGHSVTQWLIQNIGKAAPSDARQIFTHAIENIQSHRSTAGVLFVVGLVLALWSASGYIAAFMRASNVVWDVEEGRPLWTTIPLRLAVTLVTVVL
ncbi:MAG: YihY/virulence factor BrkB family protein, partial [Solirubrobacteraceae bacterium]